MMILRGIGDEQAFKSKVVKDNSRIVSFVFMVFPISLRHHFFTHHFSAHLFFCNISSATSFLDDIEPDTTSIEEKPTSHNRRSARQATSYFQGTP